MPISETNILYSKSQEGENNDMTIELLIGVICLLFLSHYLNKKDIIAPSFIFCAGFCFSAIWAVAYKVKWDLNLRTDTFIVLFGGISIFIVAAMFIQTISKLIRRQRTILKQVPLYIHIETWKKVLFIGIEAITICLTIYYIIKLTGGSWNEWNRAISIYKTRYVNDPNFSIPGYVARLRVFVDALGYWYCVVTINNWFAKKKLDALSAIIYILSTVSGVSVGSRGWAVSLLLGLFVCIILYMNKTSGFHKSVKFSTLVKTGLVLAVVLLSYQGLGSILGIDTSSINPIDYLAMYCGGGIKNLDIFMSHRNTTSSLVGTQTFIYVIKGFQYRLGFSNIVNLDMPFNQVNGYELGNVYTTFYPFVYDLGVFGVFLLTPLMAIIVQSIYERTKRGVLKKAPLMSIILYSYVFSTLVFSFFSNKFYETVFSESFLWRVLFWYLFTQFFCKNNFIRRRVKYD